GETLVDEGVVGRQQVEDVAVLAHDAVEEELRFALKRFAQRVVEVGELVMVRRDRLEVAQVQPLPGKVADERVRAAIGDHALHLALEYGGLTELPPCGEIEELFVRNAAPQKERQPGRELDIADPMDRAGSDAAVFLNAKDERRAGENPTQCQLNPGVERALLAP